MKAKSAAIEKGTDPSRTVSATQYMACNIIESVYIQANTYIHTYIYWYEIGNAMVKRKKFSNN